MERKPTQAETRVALRRPGSGLTMPGPLPGFGRSRPDAHLRRHATKTRRSSFSRGFASTGRIDPEGPTQHPFRDRCFGRLDPLPIRCRSGWAACPEGQSRLDQTLPPASLAVRRALRPCGKRATLQRQVWYVGGGCIVPRIFPDDDPRSARTSPRGPTFRPEERRCPKA